MEHVEDIYPLTPTQEGILFHWLRSGDPELYFEQVRCTVTGPFDLERYRRAWETVVAAHPALRTSFVWKGVRHPVQVVHRSAGPEVEFLEVGRTPGALEAIARDRRRTAFDLQKAPVFRIAVLRLDENTTHLIWDFHHILLDGWSAVRVFDQVLDQYERPGRPVPVGPATPRDHQRWLAAQDHVGATQHWEQLLVGVDTSQRLRIGTEPPPAPAAFDMERCEARLEPNDTAAVVAAASRHGVSLNVLVVAAWALVLERLVDADDVLFGIVSSGRPSELDGMDEAVGMFLTTLPMRIDTGADLAITDWLRTIQGQQADLLAHQHVSLSTLRRVAGAEAGTDPFETVLVFENYPVREQAEGDGLGITERRVHEQTHYDLTLMVLPGDELRFSILYNARRFDASDIALVAELFRSRLALLGSAAATDPRRPIELIDEPGVGPAGDVPAHLVEPVRSGDSVELPVRSLPEMLAGVAVDRPAFLDADGRVLLDHGRLSERAQMLAARLANAHVGEGDVVAVLTGRRPELAVAALATWMCGAVVLALDPDDRRVDDLVHRSGAVVRVLAGDAGVDGLVVLEGDERGAEPVHRWDPPPAFLVYTSGSTGTPKPVALTHHGVVNRIAWQTRLQPFTRGEVALSKVPLAFVDHLWEFWGPLANGCPVVAIQDDADLFGIARLIERHSVRRLVLVPSLLDALLDAGDRTIAALCSLESMTVSGERLTTATADRAAKLLPSTRLLNFYGMSEATADVTWCDVAEVDRATWAAIGPPAGTPIDNMAIRLTDRRGRPVLTGMSGEIEVAGAGLAAGLVDGVRLVDRDEIGLPEQWYRTGDRGRWRIDGRLELGGRLDRQVKVRGARVDLEQVEAVLRSGETVHEAAVELVGDVLVAWVEPVGGFDAEALREFLSHRLLPQAVPARIVPTSSWPRTPSGKLDRVMLQTSLATPGEVTEAGASPATREPTEKEAAMIELWQTVLAEQLGPDDDFFERGGDSLLALRLFSRIDKHYGVELGLAQVFEAPTPAAMVRLLERRRGPRVVILAAEPDALARRLAAHARVESRTHNEVTTLLVDGLADVWSEKESEPVSIVADRGHAPAGLEMVRRLGERGFEIGLLGLIAAEDLMPPDGTGPRSVVWFEPVEAVGRVPLLTAPEVRDRLRPRPAFDTWAREENDVVPIPGTASTALGEPSVTWLAQLLLERLGVGDDELHHLVRISGDAEVPPVRTLYAVHGEFGNVVGYRDLATALGAGWSVVGVQASGVQGIEPLHRSIEEMAEAYLDQILQRQSEGPYLIGGYSAGGTVAYEMARQLEADGREVAALVWFDHFRLGAVRPETRAGRAMRLARHRLSTARLGRAEIETGMLRRRARRLTRQISGRHDDTWWWQITDLAADRAEAETLRAGLLRDNIREARHRYDHRPISTPVILYEAEQLDAGRLPDRGWNDDELMIRRVPVPGDHSTLLAMPHVQAIADDLRRRFGP